MIASGLVGCLSKRQEPTCRGGGVTAEPFRAAGGMWAEAESGKVLVQALSGTARLGKSASCQLAFTALLCWLTAVSATCMHKELCLAFILCMWPRSLTYAPKQSIDHQADSNHNKSCTSQMQYTTSQVECAAQTWTLSAAPSTMMISW